MFGLQDEGWSERGHNLGRWDWMDALMFEYHEFWSSFLGI